MLALSVRLVVVGAAAFLVACQHSTKAIGSQLDGGDADQEQLKMEALQACTAAEECTLVALIPDGGHSGCGIALNRNRVSEFYATSWKSREADFRKIDSMSNCRGQRGVVCSEGLCHPQ